ncbi:MAG: hypothetical protein CBB79_00065 [Synechococcus sp. TMED19]|nr:MAG: hypothetical protein CBB79_00065 [Synechococcus sp. TMED19]
MTCRGDIGKDERRRRSLSRLVTGLAGAYHRAPTQLLGPPLFPPLLLLLLLLLPLLVLKGN